MAGDEKVRVVRVGSTLEALLREDDDYDELRSDALRAVLHYEPMAVMKTQMLAEVRMPRRMNEAGQRS